MPTALYTNHLGGAAPGTAVTIANSDDDGSSPWGVAPQPTSGNIWTYSAQGIQRTQDTTGAYVRGNHDAADEMRGGLLFKFTVSGAPAGYLTLGNVRGNSPADTLMGSPGFTTAKRFRFSHGTSSTQYTSADSNVASDGDYWIQFLVNGTTAAVEMKVWAASDLVTPFYSVGPITGLANITATQPRYFRFGTWNSTAGGANYPVMKFDDYVRWGVLPSGDIPFIDAFPAPSNIVATPMTSTQIDLSWDAVPTATGYDVEADSVIISTNQPGLSYSHTGLSPSQEVDYRVRSVK